MLRRWVQKLRHKPKSVRDNIALGVAGSITAAILLAWVFVTPEKIGTVADSSEDRPGTFSLLFDRIKDQTASIADSFNSVVNVAEEQSADTSTPENDSLATTTIATTSTTTAATASTTATTTIRTVRIATTTASTTR